MADRPGLEFMKLAQALEPAYLEFDDPVNRSGFSGGRECWVKAHGVDLGPRLIDLARNRLPAFAPNFHIADAWTWDPPRRWTFVYALLDLSPAELTCQWLSRLHRWVEPGGRLIIGSYGARGTYQRAPNDPVDVASVFERCGLPVTGSNEGGDPLLTSFAWTDLGK